MNLKSLPHETGKNSHRFWLTSRNFIDIWVISFLIVHTELMKFLYNMFINDRTLFPNNKYFYTFITKSFPLCFNVNLLCWWSLRYRVPSAFGTCAFFKHTWVGTLIIYVNLALQIHFYSITFIFHFFRWSGSMLTFSKNEFYSAKLE